MLTPRVSETQETLSLLKPACLAAGASVAGGTTPNTGMVVPPPRDTELAAHGTTTDDETGLW